MHESLELLLLTPVIRFIVTLLIFLVGGGELGATLHKICSRSNAKWVTDRSHLNHNSRPLKFSDLQRKREGGDTTLTNFNARIATIRRVPCWGLANRKALPDSRDSS